MCIAATMPMPMAASLKNIGRVIERNLIVLP